MVGNKIRGKGKEVTPERRVEGSDDMNSMKAVLFTLVIYLYFWLP